MTRLAARAVEELSGLAHDNVPLLVFWTLFACTALFLCAKLLGMSRKKKRPRAPGSGMRGSDIPAIESKSPRERRPASGKDRQER